MSFDHLICGISRHWLQRCASCSSLENCWQTCEGIASCLSPTVRRGKHPLARGQSNGCKAPTPPSTVFSIMMCIPYNNWSKNTQLSSNAKGRHFGFHLASLLLGYLPSATGGSPIESSAPLHGPHPVSMIWITIMSLLHSTTEFQSGMAFIQHLGHQRDRQL